MRVQLGENACSLFFRLPGGVQDATKTAATIAEDARTVLVAAFHPPTHVFRFRDPLGVWRGVAFNRAVPAGGATLRGSAVELLLNTDLYPGGIVFHELRFVAGCDDDATIRMTVSELAAKWGL